MYNLLINYVLFKIRKMILINQDVEPTQLDKIMVQNKNDIIIIIKIKSSFILFIANY